MFHRFLWKQIIPVLFLIVQKISEDKFHLNCFTFLPSCHNFAIIFEFKDSVTMKNTLLKINKWNLAYSIFVKTYLKISNINQTIWKSVSTKPVHFFSVVCWSLVRASRRELNFQIFQQVIFHFIPIIFFNDSKENFKFRPIWSKWWVKTLSTHRLDLRTFFFRLLRDLCFFIRLGVFDSFGSRIYSPAI